MNLFKNNLFILNIIKFYNYFMEIGDKGLGIGPNLNRYYEYI